MIDIAINLTKASANYLLEFKKYGERWADNNPESFRESRASIPKAFGMWAGSFLLSSVFAYFLGDAKSMKEQIQCQNSKNGFFFKITDSKIITSTLI